MKSSVKFSSAFYRISAGSVFVDRVIYGKRDYMKLLFK